MINRRHGNLRKFNRYFFNRITRLFAGRFLYSLVFHTGRISGKKYSTPIMAAKMGDHIYIPLPYGTDTDWYLNIMHRGQCEVKINGKIYHAENPEIAEEITALSAFSPSFQKAFEKAEIHQFLGLISPP